MADTVQQPYAPSVAELFFVLFESTKLVSYTQGDRFPQTRNTLQDAVVRILGIHTRGVSRSAVCLDVNGPIPTLLIASDCDSDAALGFLNYVETTIALLRTLATRPDEGPDPVAAAIRTSASVLRRSLGPHAREYSRLRDRLQQDIDSGIMPERPWVMEEDPDFSEPSDPGDVDELDELEARAKCSRPEAEKWRDGLTCVLDVIDWREAPAGSGVAPPPRARDSDSNSDCDAGAGDATPVGKFWAWAKQRRVDVNRRGGKRAYTHVGEYPEPPSATDLLRYVDHIVQAIVFPITVFTAAEPEKPEPSTGFAWLHDLTIRRLENSPSSPSRQSSSESSTSMIDPERLERWLFDLVYNPFNNARTSTEVLERIVSTDVDAVRAKWARHVAQASVTVHPEMTHLVEVVNTRLAIAVTVPVPEKSNESKDDRRRRRRRRAYPSLVACTGTSCPTCVLCYKATKAAYGLGPNTLNLFPTEGEIRTTTPDRSSPCCVPPLPPAVEEKLKVMLTGEIESLVERAIMRLSPKPRSRFIPRGRGRGKGDNHPAADNL